MIRESNSSGGVPQFVRLDYAYATRAVLYSMAGIMAAAFVIALVTLRRGVQTELVGDTLGAEPDAAAPVSSGDDFDTARR